MVFRGIQEYIAQDANNIPRDEDEKAPSNIIIIIHIGLLVSSYYRVIVSDCRLPFYFVCLQTGRKKSACGVRACVE